MSPPEIPVKRMSVPLDKDSESLTVSPPVPLAVMSMAPPALTFSDPPTEIGWALLKIVSDVG